MVKDLVPADEKYLQSMAGRGLETIPADILPIPRVNLVQASSKDTVLLDGKKAELGFFFNTGLQAAFETIDCAVLRVGTSRVRFEKGVLGSPPLCRSSNGILSEDGQKCAECEFAKWTALPPECKLCLDFLCIEDESQKPFLLSASGTSFKAARNALAAMIFSALPAFGHKVKLESKFIESKKGDFYVLVFRILGRRPVEEIRYLEERYNQYTGALPEGAQEEATKDLGDMGENKLEKIQQENNTKPTGDENVDPEKVPF